MQKNLFLLFLIPLILIGCTSKPSQTIDIDTAKEIALKAYPDCKIVSVVSNDNDFEPSYIITLTNNKDLYILTIATDDGSIIRTHKLLS